MYHETNHVEENIEPNDEERNSSDKVDRHGSSNATHQQLLKSHKKFGNMNGIAYNNTSIKGKRWAKKNYEKEMRRLEDEKPSHYMWFKCHKMGHLAMSCPKKKKKKPQDSSEDESKNSQMQANINHKVDNKLGKKKVRRGERRGSLNKYYSSDDYYECHNKGPFVKGSPKGNNPKSSSIHEGYLLRKDGNGTVKATIANHSIVHAQGYLGAQACSD